MNFELTVANDKCVSERPNEIVERKGKGHPDVLCDKAAEELSIALCEYYLENYGRVQHHNVDKCVLSGGQSDAVFGGGELLEPIYLLLVGRAVGVVTTEKNSHKVPIGKLALKSTNRFLAEDLPNLNPPADIIVDYKIRSGSTDLVGNFDDGVVIPRANDTSIGVGFAPFSPTEKLTYETERLLNARETKKRFPEIGEDIKVMGVRRGSKLRLTIAVAMISKYIPDQDHYMNIKQEVESMALDLGARLTDLDVSAKVNTADEPEKGLFYLTVTGTSAEHGDDGQVGRGNRANGLITPYRPMTLEAAAGKNPISHVGKTFNIVSREIADRIVKETPIESAEVFMVSEIGAPITEPQIVEVKAYSDETTVRRSQADIDGITKSALERIPVLWKEIIKRKHELY